MSENVLNCSQSVYNMTAYECEARYGVIDSGFLSFEQQSNSYANALLEATWTGMINEVASTRVYVFPSADDAVRTQEDPVFFEGNLSKRRMVRKGRVSLALEYHAQRDCVWAVINSFNGQRMYFAARTENEAIIAGDDGTNFVFVPVDVYTSDPIPPENKDDEWKVILYIYFVETQGNFAKALLPYDSTYNSGTLWKASGLEGIVDVTMTEVSAAVSSVVVDITGLCDGREITGLVTADFTVTGLSSVAMSNNRATLTPTSTFTSPLSIELKNQPSMTTKGYEMRSAITVTF